MTPREPRMSEERLAYVKKHYEEYGTVPNDGELLAEIDALRAENEALKRIAEAAMVVRSCWLHYPIDGQRMKDSYSSLDTALTAWEERG